MGEELLPPSIADGSRRKEHVHRVRGVNEGGARTEVSVRSFALAMDEPPQRHGTDSAQTPLETVVAALVGCKGATIHSVAQAMRYAYAGVRFEASSVIDLRGPRGVKGVRPYFESVDLRIEVFSDEPERRFEQLVRNVEARCPVANLLRAAEVALTIDWRVRPAEEATAD